MNGCEMEARIDFSLLTCSTCFSRITSEMVIIFRAKNCREGMSRASTTRPNVPVPGGECEGVGGVVVKRCLQASSPTIHWRVTSVGVYQNGTVGFMELLRTTSCQIGLAAKYLVLLEELGVG